MQTEKKQLKLYVQRVIEMRRLQDKAERLKTSGEFAAARSAWTESKKIANMIDEQTTDIIGVIEQWDQLKLKL
jgi:hypothetical protein